jgi:hypothetical protein
MVWRIRLRLVKRFDQLAEEVKGRATALFCNPTATLVTALQSGHQGIAKWLKNNAASAFVALGQRITVFWCVLDGFPLHHPTPSGSIHTTSRKRELARDTGKVQSR